jgi:hypothetical protein
VASQGLELTGDVPDGWISVDPRVVNEDAASMVLLRRSDLDKPFTTNITVSEQAIRPGEDLSALAAAYRRGLEGQAENLAVVREGLISDSPSRQYAQELRFRVGLGGRDVDIMQSQFLLEVPTEEPTTLLLLQLLYSAPIDVYDVAKHAVLEFMQSISAEYAGGAGSHPGQTSGGPVPAHTVSKEQLEIRVQHRLEQTARQYADAVVCNGGLRAEVGAVQRCALTVGEDKLGVTVTVVNVWDAGHVNFDIRVDDRPMV